jgi:hypothetical protein
VTEIFTSGAEFELTSRWADNLIAVISNADSLDTFTVLKFIQTLGRLLQSRGEFEAAALCNLLCQEQPESFIPIWASSLIDSLQMTEVFESLTGLDVTWLLPHKLIYANMLAEVGLMDKAKAYADSIVAKREHFGPLKSNLFFISHLRFLNERI